MAIIAGVTVDWQLSPRVITIPSTEVEVTIVDLQDTLLDLEDDVEGILWTTLRETSGGEDLGGGVFVGWTMELQNAVIAPAPRLISVSSGTATSANPLGTVLTDSGATFISDGVEAGASIFNSTDGSVTSVISVDSETQLTHYALDDGTDNDWDMSDAYKVWNEVQFNISGGNLVAVDGVGVATSPIRSTFGNEILKTSSSSATFVSQEQLEHSSFSEHVAVSVLSGTSGTDYPIGTHGSPSNNIPDATLIAANRGFTALSIFGDITLDTGDIVDGYTLIGDSANRTTITVNAGASTVGTEFNTCFLQGTLDGGARVRLSIIGSLDYVDGIVFNSMIDSASTVTLSGFGTAHFLDCYSGTPGTGTSTIDFDGSGSALAMRGYNGGILLTNKSGADSVSIDLVSGQIKLDPNATTGVINGTIVCRGTGKVIDSDTGLALATGSVAFNGATIINETLNTAGISQGVWDEPKADHEVDGSIGDHVRRIKNQKV